MQKGIRFVTILFLAVSLLGLLLIPLAGLSRTGAGDVTETTEDRPRQGPSRRPLRSRCGSIRCSRRPAP